MLANIVGKFPGDSTCSKLRLFSLEMAANVTSPSRSEGNLGVVVGNSIGSVWFEFILPLLVAAGVAVLGAAVLVIVWATWAYMAQTVKAVHPSPLVRADGKNGRASPYLMRGRSVGLSGATGVSVRGECGDDDWVPIGG